MHLRNRAPEHEVALLERLPPFRRWSRRTLCRLVKHGERLHVDAGRTATRQRRTCDEFYVLLAGRGALLHDGRSVVTLDRGDLLDDVSRHIGDDHALAFRAEEAMDLLCIDLASVIDL